MNKITFTNDLKLEIVMDEKDFKEEIVNAIQVATIEKEYELGNLSPDFVEEEVTGVISSFHNHKNNMSKNGKEIIENLLNGFSSMIKVAKPINGIGINGNEFLLDENGYPVLFESIEDAKEFLLVVGCSEKELEEFSFIQNV